MFIDTHCHLDFLEKEGIKIEDAVKRAVKKNVKIIVVNGVNPSNNKKIIELAQMFSEVKAALGMYPIDALKLSERQINEEIKLIENNRDEIVAIGEIGLDFMEDIEHKTRQKEIFSKFVNLSKKLNKPISVHSRKAELETVELLENLKAKKVIMHCFSGKMKLVDEIVKNGWCLSIPANITYSQQFQDVVKRVPIENLFCETDAPYLHPEKKWPNEPANVIESYKKIAEIKELSLKEVSEKIMGNYQRLFKD